MKEMKMNEREIMNEFGGKKIEQGRKRSGDEMK